MSTTRSTARPIWRRPATALTVIGVLVLALIAATTTYVSGSEPTPGSAKAFDAVRYANEKYDTEVVPQITKSAVPITDLLRQIAADPNAAGKRYGHRSGDSSPYAYATAGEGVAGEVRGTLLPVAITGLPRGTTVVLQIGPAINGTALRDATGLIDFNDFLNQMEYANAATELNNKVKAKVLAGFDPTAAADKMIRFTGAFAYGANHAVIQVTPVALEVMK